MPVAIGLRLLDRISGPDSALTLVKDADHRFSTPACLRRIEQAIEAVAPVPAGSPC